jgi:hypothetical protein
MARDDARHSHQTVSVGCRDTDTRVPKGTCSVSTKKTAFSRQIIHEERIERAAFFVIQYLKINIDIT